MDTVYYGDNLDVMRKFIRDETVDLCYIDPPFNSKRNYNVLFRSETGTDSESQITAFEDTWHWNLAAETNRQRHSSRLEKIDRAAKDPIRNRHH